MSFDQWEKLVLNSWLAGTPLAHLMEYLVCHRKYTPSYQELDYALKAYVLLERRFNQVMKELNL